MKTPTRHYSEIKYVHRPSGKVYTSDGAGGLLTDGSNVSLPQWLIVKSLDWFELIDGNATQYNPFEEKC